MLGIIASALGMSIYIGIVALGVAAFCLLCYYLPKEDIPDQD